VSEGRFETYSTADLPERAGGESFEDVLARRMSRRGAIKSAVVATGVVALGGGMFQPSAAAAPVDQPSSSIRFQPIRPDTSDQVTVSPGYESRVLIRWGDPLFRDTPIMDITRQSAAQQERQFGFNCDFVAYMPLPRGSTSATQGLLFVNHEYTDGLTMFPGYDVKLPSESQVNIELAAHGASVVRVHRDPLGAWWYDSASELNRRITGTTPMRLSGPAVGHEWLKTTADSSGTNVLGMLNNCGGGWTPWGTILTCEENFHQYFGFLDKLAADDPRRAIHTRYGLPKAESERQWERYHDRFDLSREPNEPFRFGWVVEIDPYDPTHTPVKRTALGRMKHEAATCVLAPSGQVVVYSGDDERFDYVYKFVTAGRYSPNVPAANRDLLDEGTLYAAKFNDDGTGQWLPLVFGQGPLTPANGFTSQADVLIKTRQAADALKATKMDRPEDVEANPVNGKVYMVFTNNTQRGAEGRPGPDAANPRANNAFGHIIEATEDGGDYAGTAFTWEIFILGGNPSDPTTYFAGFPKDQVSPIGSPDNITFDTRGNLWIATDGQPNNLKVNDAIHAVPVDGSERGFVRQLLSAVPGAEVASLVFNSDDTALFAAIQHPGEGGTLDKPISVWPTGSVALPSVVVVTKTGGGQIGA
jgi:hypothetical protein